MGLWVLVRGREGGSEEGREGRREGGREGRGVYCVEWGSTCTCTCSHTHVSART